jgi:hypothetical protein
VKSSELERLTKHFCEVNNCSIEDFEKHKVKVYDLRLKRERFNYRVDFGKLSPERLEKEWKKKFWGVEVTVRKRKKIDGIPWLPDDEYLKARGQLAMQYNGVLEPFKIYGLDIFIPGAIEQAVRLAEDFSLRCRGVDKPIDIERVRNGWTPPKSRGDIT